ncbi:G protein-coupled receptor GPR1 [Cyphellophora attinorum]|uniref:G protein-coupled receptor GPR1 n=1 Tax=Cyphellophora attinorum TaxID=1664694 RepID=A0A0N1HND7_9EURO|nr:G protein-coupled receptor GPR1 [Phialophora attinorum]KPI39000.1 G protein-coupled receptor GPR1 [Phialophora attinorum]
MSEFSSGLVSHIFGTRDSNNAAVGTFTPSQNRATLIVGLTCACISLAIAFTTLRWFVVMRRLFRHHLILLLVLSDACKAVWYFVFGVVAISGGPVSSSSSFCQAQGFLLLMAMEMSDMSILIIALHTVLCIFKPGPRIGEGGLYPYRHWLYPVWLAPPILAASLAFIKEGDAYSTAGTYCFLPKRPFWYRLALSWIPRYIIITLILLMYASIYIYVHVKFHGFRNLQANESSRDSTTLTSRRTTEATVVDSAPSPRTVTVLPPVASPPRARLSRPGMLRGNSYSSIKAAKEPVEPRPPWEAMSFITESPFASAAAPAAASPNPKTSPTNSESSVTDTSEAGDPRKQSETPTNFTNDTVVTHATFNTGANLKASGDPASNGTTDHLKATRAAIRKQLRFLFIYPIIYILMWTFPFASHVTMYSDNLVKHPIYWLSILSTISLALQAGVNGVVFSFKERPWRRIDRDSRLSVNLRLWRRGCLPSEPEFEEEDRNKPKRQANTNWWEAEGRKRKDSVWMGTDMLTTFTSRRQQRPDTALDSIHERSVA